MRSPSGEIEKEYFQQGLTNLAGADEAGRGPLAGPLVAGAVLFQEIPALPLNDSKQLSPQKREELFPLIQQTAASFAFGIVEVEELNEINNMHQASLLAMKRAVLQLSPTPQMVLIDGKFIIPDLGIAQKSLVKGDSLSLLIAAASILAKVKRDHIMLEFDRLYPQYGFARHKGYGTAEHLEALAKFGPCKLHRRNFHLVKEHFQAQMELSL